MKSWTIQSIFRDYFSRKNSFKSLPLYQIKAVESLRNCRTSKMGMHTQYCDQGHMLGVYYNSCHHRGCPKCQFLAKEQWLTTWSERCLNTAHHHWVFTIPHELLPIWRFNRELFQDFMFQAVGETIHLLCRDPQHLNAKPGFILAMHTWGRNLSEHPHVHCLITHGGSNSKREWVKPKRKVMLPIKVLRQIYRGKLRDKLLKSMKSGQLVIPTNDPEIKWRNTLNKLGVINWQIYACKAYEHGYGVVKYLARYLRGGPLNEKQIVDVNREQIKFRYKSHQTKKYEIQQYSLSHFIRLFLTHLPLFGKTTQRYYGIYHPAATNELNDIRKEFNQPPFINVKVNWSEKLTELGVDLTCPYCGSANRMGEVLKISH
jgi:hypothetical protein